MIVRQFGEIVRVVETPGVSVKIPFIQTSAPIPKALQIYDIPKSDVITKDKKSMIADAFVLWKISDPVRFTRHLNGQVAQRCVLETGIIKCQKRPLFLKDHTKDPVFVSANWNGVFQSFLSLIKCSGQCVFCHRCV